MRPPTSTNARSTKIEGSLCSTQRSASCLAPPQIEHRTWKWKNSLSIDRSERGSKLIRAADLHRLKMQSKRPGSIRRFIEHAVQCVFTVCAGMPQRRNARHSRQHRLQLRQSFRHQFRSKKGESGDISTWPREADHQSVLNRVAHHRYHNRNRTGRLPRGQSAGRIRCDDHVDVQVCQFAGQVRELLNVAVRFSILNDDVMTFRIAEYPKAFPKCVGVRSTLLRVQRTLQQKADEFRSCYGAVRVQREATSSLHRREAI